MYKNSLSICVCPYFQENFISQFFRFGLVVEYSVNNFTEIYKTQKHIDLIYQPSGKIIIT